MGYKPRGNPPALRNRTYSKPYYPTTRRSNNHSPFSNNLSNDMRFGGKGNDVSGYVKREIIMEDSKGNKKMAREVQFFNSAKRIGRIFIDE